MSHTKDFYESESFEWFPRNNYFRHTGDIFENQVLEKCGFLKQGTLILDDGCGDGRLIEKISNNNKTLIGIDLSSKQLELAKNKNLNNVHLIRASVDCLPFRDNTFDHILSWSVLIHIEKRDTRLKAIEEISRTLKQEGSALVMLKNYPSLLYHIGSFVYKGFKGKRPMSSFVKEGYHQVSWTEDSLFLYRAKYSEVEEIILGLKMKIEWIKAQGFLLPDEFDIILDWIMKNKYMGTLLGSIDQVLSSVFPTLSNCIAYKISKKRE